MNWFVYSKDDFYENGGIGLKKFDAAKEAQEIIQQRMSKKVINEADIDNYTVIEGKERELITVETVTKVGIV